jgi:hypothetical protein
MTSSTPKGSPAKRSRADLVAYLDSRPVGELAELPSSRKQPLGLGVLMVTLTRT